MAAGEVCVEEGFCGRAAGVQVDGAEEGADEAPGGGLEGDAVFKAGPYVLDEEFRALGVVDGGSVLPVAQVGL